MIEVLGFLRRKRQNLLHARSIRNISDHLLIGTSADLFLYFHANGLKVETELLQNVYRDTLPELDQPEQQMFGPHKIMVETVSLFARQRQHLLCPRRKVVHCFVWHITH